MAGTVREEAIKLKKNIGAIYDSAVEKFCPPFEETGPVVTCEPVSGYMLTTETDDDDAVIVFRVGKNLLKLKPGTTTLNGVTFNIREDGTVVVNGTATADAAITISERLPIKAGVTYTLSGCTGGGYKTYQLYIEVSRVINIYNANTIATKVASGSGFVEAKFCVYAGTTVSNLVIKPQLEVGSIATDFEPGREIDGLPPGEPIPALDGVNTIFADTGNVTVTGRFDPIKRFCPSFIESGRVVTCEPVSGYMLTTETDDDDATDISRVGKNLLTVTPRKFTSEGVTFDIREDGTVVVNGTAKSDRFEPIGDAAEIISGVTYTLSGCTGGSASTYQMYMAGSGVIGLYNYNKPATAVATGSRYLQPMLAVYAGTTVSNLVIKPQLEVGSIATDFEPGRLSDLFAPGEYIPALDGVNTLWANTGNVTVTGIADPIRHFCPSIYETAPVVACAPVYGYPLTVQTDGATKVYRCGKNLLKPWVRKDTREGITVEIYEDGTVVANGTATGNMNIAVAEQVSIKEGVTYTLSGCSGGSASTYQLVIAISGTIGLYNAGGPNTNVANGSGSPFPTLYVYAGTTVSNLVIKPQLEIGSIATEYEPYRTPEEFSPGKIPALDGVNTIWADSGTITVTGIADPIAMIERLSNAASAASTTV